MAGDGEFALEAVGALTLFDEIADRTGHLVEGVTEDAELVAMLDAHAMREIAGLDELRGVIKVAHGGGNAAGKHNTDYESGGFDQHKGDREEQKSQQVHASKFTEGGKDERVQIGWPSIKS